jgi:hypothetical protein
MSSMTRRRPPGAASPLWIRSIALAVVALLASGTASAQGTSPSPQPPPAAAPGAAPAPQPPPAAPAPGLEAGDTAPVPGESAPAGATAPVTPLPAAGAPAPGALEAPLVVPAPNAPRHRRFYEQHWFWGAVGVVVITGMIVLALSLNSADPATPNTRLGDMRAF